MDFNKQYELLASQLGDIEYRLTLLNLQKAELLETIKKLDKLAGEVKAANAQKDPQAEGDNAGNNSPA